MLNYLACVKYGERFKELRGQLWKRTAEHPDRTLLALAKRLGSPYPATVYNIEKQWRVPTLVTIERHAMALGCAPWELLQNVQTEYDDARALAKLRRDEAEQRWRALLKRYQDTTKRGKKTAKVVSVAEKKGTRSLN